MKGFGWKSMDHMHVNALSTTACLFKFWKNAPRQRYNYNMLIRQQITHSLMRENKLLKSTQRWPHMLRCLSTQLESLCSSFEFLPTTAKTASRENIRKTSVLTCQRCWQIRRTRCRGSCCSFLGLFTIKQEGIVAELIIDLFVCILHTKIEVRWLVHKVYSTYFSCDSTSAAWLETSSSIHTHHPCPISTQRIIADTPTFIIASNDLSNLSLELDFNAG